MTIINFRTVTAALLLGLTVAATPALAAQRIHHPGGYAARAQAIPGDAGDGISARRAAALRDCSGKEDKFSQYAWGNFSSDEYRACMAQHDETE